jgi:hypothetical protein
MNDLIKQFAIECAGQKEWDFPKDPGSYTFTPDEVTRFANFIVKECIDIAFHRGDNVDYFKEHFRVES